MSSKPCLRNSIAAAMPPRPAPTITTRSPPRAIHRKGTLGGGSGPAALGDPALEPLDPSTGVHQLLPTGIERVTRRADLDMNLGFCGASRELVAACAAHMGFDVLRMNFGLHYISESSRCFVGRHLNRICGSSRERRSAEVVWWRLSGNRVQRPVAALGRREPAALGRDRAALDAVGVVDGHVD